MNINFVTPHEAFADAIKSKILSENQATPNYAGSFMYMHTKDGIHYFKNIITRKYGFDHQTVLDATKLDSENV